MIPKYFTSGDSLMTGQLQFGKEQLWECNLIFRAELGDLLHLAVSEKGTTLVLQNNFHSTTAGTAFS